MNEQDFKNALRQTMTVQPAPPPMSDAVVLEAAHRDTKRRRAMMAGLGSAAAVAAVVVGVAVIAPGATGSGSGGVGVGAQVTSTPVESAPPPASGSASQGSGKSSETLPPGMTDRTPKNGPEFDRGQALATKLDEVVPAGYGAPGDLQGEGDMAGSTLKTSQANLDSNKGQPQWSYTAVTPLTKGNGVGRLLVEVQTPREANTGAVCDLPTLWGEKGDCTEIVVGGKPVGVYNSTTSERFDQWATFRHDDGTVVYVGQAADYTYAGLPALAGLPFTADQLAALAADPRFNLD